MKFRIKPMQHIKGGLLIVFGLLLIQIVTLNIYAEKQKAETIIEDLKLLVHTEQFDSLAFESNLQEESVKLISGLNLRFKDTFQHVDIIESNEWGKFRVDSNYLTLRIIDSSKNKLIFDSETDAGTLHYGEKWMNKYIWILYKWFKLEHKNIGVS